MENRNEVKKVLYKEKPVALFQNQENGNNLYKTKTSIGEVGFSIPEKEMVNEDGKRIIGNEVEAQLLIRWIV